jgi:hypothetical protein
MWLQSEIMSVMLVKGSKISFETCVKYALQNMLQIILQMSCEGAPILAWLRDRVVVGNIGVVVVEEIAIDTIGVLVENVVGVIG